MKTDEMEHLIATTGVLDECKITLTKLEWSIVLGTVITAIEGGENKEKTDRQFMLYTSLKSIKDKLECELGMAENAPKAMYNVR